MTARSALPGAFGGHPGPVLTLAYGPNGVLASGGWDGTIRLWDPQAAAPAHEVLRGHAGSVRALAFTADGGLLVSSGRDRTVRVWDASAAMRPVSVWHVTEPVVSLAVSADGSRIAGTDRAGLLQCWNRSTSARLSANARTAVFTALAFPPGAADLVAADSDGHLWRWPRDAPAPSPLPGGCPWHVESLAFAPDGRHLAGADGGGELLLWPWPLTGGPDATEAAYTAPTRAHAVAYSPDGSQLATGEADGTVRVRNLTTRQEQVFRFMHAGAAYSVAFSPDGNRLASAGDDGVIRIRTLGTDAQPRELLGHTSEIMSVAYAPDGERIATGDVDGVVRVWETHRGELVTSLPGERAWVESLAFLDDGRLLAAEIGTVLRVWETTGFEELAPGSPEYDQADRAERPAAHPAASWLDQPRPEPARIGGYQRLAVSPDGTLIATAHNDSAVRLRDRTGRVRRTLNNHAGAVRGVAFAPDGETLVSVGDDGRIVEWSARTGEFLRGSGQLVRSLPAVPGVLSDEPSAQDRLGMADDVRTLATLVAATGTRPPLAIAILGPWGSGKSSFIEQLCREVSVIAERSRANPGGTLFAGGVRQVRFNAWHYNDADVWTGLIDQLFRTLATDPDAGPEHEAPDPEKVRRTAAGLRERLDRESAFRDRLRTRIDSSRRVTAFAEAMWRERGSMLLGAGLAGLGLLVRWAWQTAGALLGVPTAMLEQVFRRGRSITAVGGGLDTALVTAVQESEARVAALVNRLAQVDAATRLALLLREDAARYAGARGFIGQVHRDLDRLERELAKVRHDTGTAGHGGSTLERVVLYIDDLDRCTSDRVVEVLRAVHLMLAMPLFVVVVAADPRWVRSALREHYSELSAADPDATSSADPLDYLDKIFQIPFALNRADDPTVAAYLRTLLDDVALTAVSAPPDADGSASRGSPSHDDEAAAATRGTPDVQVDRPRPAGSTGDVFLDLRPHGLAPSAAEVEFVQWTAPLLPTPRAAKKLANLYRLVRVGIPAAGLAAFVRSGEFRTVQLMLALVVGMPSGAREVFTAVGAADESEDIVEVVRGAGEAGARLARLLTDIRTAHPDADFDTAVFRRWGPRLARHSFHTLDLR